MSIITDTKAAERWVKKNQQYQRWQIAQMAEFKRLTAQIDRARRANDKLTEQKIQDRLSRRVWRAELLMRLRERHLERCPLRINELRRSSLLKVGKQ